METAGAAMRAGTQAGKVPKTAPSPASKCLKRGGQTRPLIDGALGVEFSRNIRAPDDMMRNTRRG